MSDVLAMLMVAHDAAEQGDEDMRVRLLDGLVDVEYRERIGWTREFDWRGHVKCAWCGARHAQIYGKTQGDDCCAWVFERDGVWWLAGGYGSSVADMTLFRFERNPPHESADPICDACIRVKLASGDLVYERERGVEGL